MHHQDHNSDSSGCAGAVLALSPRGCQGLCQRLFAPQFRPAAPLNLVALHYRRGGLSVSLRHSSPNRNLPRAGTAPVLTRIPVVQLSTAACRLPGTKFLND